MLALSFSHAILPQGVSPLGLQCNNTYCKNTLVSESIDDINPHDEGVEVTIKLTTCPLNYGNIWNSEVFKTKFGIAVLISETRPYNLSKRNIMQMNTSIGSLQYNTTITTILNQR